MYVCCLNRDKPKRCGAVNRILTQVEKCLESNKFAEALAAAQRQAAQTQAAVAAKRAEEAALLQQLEAAERAEREMQARIKAQQAASMLAVQRLQVTAARS